MAATNKYPWNAIHRHVLFILWDEFAGGPPYTGAGPTIQAIYNHIFAGRLITGTRLRDELTIRSHPTRGGQLRREIDPSTREAQYAAQGDRERAQARHDILDAAHVLGITLTHGPPAGARIAVTARPQMNHARPLIAANPLQTTAAVARTYTVPAVAPGQATQPAPAPGPVPPVVAAPQQQSVLAAQPATSTSATSSGPTQQVQQDESDAEDESEDNEDSDNGLDPSADGNEPEGQDSEAEEYQSEIIDVGDGDDDDSPLATNETHDTSDSGAGGEDEDDDDHSIVFGEDIFHGLPVGFGYPLLPVNDYYHVGFTPTEHFPRQRGWDEDTEPFVEPLSFQWQNDEAWDLIDLARSNVPGFRSDLPEYLPGTEAMNPGVAPGEVMREDLWPLFEVADDPAESLFGLVMPRQAALGENGE